jgi:endonuclease/exonuclease/phosphatase family metal-dependent hydrolase
MMAVHVMTRTHSCRTPCRWCWFRIIACSVLALASAACRRERALGPPKAVAVADDGKLALRLMSYNVRYENSGDVGSRAWGQRIPAMVRTIRAESPDVLGVQEALHGQAADLWASLPDYEFFGSGRDDGGRAGEYSGVFYQRARFERDPSDGGTFWLSDTPDKPGSMTWGNEIPRVVTWLRLTDRSTARSFYVFNTHWDHRHQGSREKAGELIARRIAGRRHPGDPVVLLGDFNAVETNPGVRRLTGPPLGLIDTFRHLHPAEALRGTLHFWNTARREQPKIDHILVSPGAEIRSAAIRNREAMATVSDHFPVVAEVAFP